MTSSESREGTSGVSPLHPQKKARDFPHRTHRRLVGWLGFALPVLVVVISRLWPVESPPGWSILESISAFYYTSATAIFVGTLFALAMFLFTYGGYEGDVADRVVGKIAGASALGVAFFPTVAPNGFSAMSWWIPWMRTAHYISAASLFLMFIVFSLWLFRRTSVSQGQPLPVGKRWRNRVYLWCGLLMVASVLWAASALLTNRAIFWPEAIALWAFAVSWLVKGRTHGPVVAAARKLVRSGRSR